MTDIELTRRLVHNVLKNSQQSLQQRIDYIKTHNYTLGSFKVFCWSYTPEGYYFWRDVYFTRCNTCDQLVKLLESYENEVFTDLTFYLTNYI